MNIVIAMDSFKGSLSSYKAASATKEGLGREAEIFLLADGGEGTSEAISEGYEAKTVAPKVRYYIKNQSVVMDVAESCGINLMRDKSIQERSTKGLGEAIKHLIDEGATDITLCLGGSGTSDCGAGMLEALGAVYKDSTGERLTGTPKDILNISYCDLTKVRQNLKGIKIRALTDVTNPLTGANGAAYVFAPQKGASAEDIRLLEAAAKRFGKISGIDTDTPGYGAAGGLGFAIAGLLGGELIPGADYVMQVTGLKDRLAKGDVDIFITGEGRADKTSLKGKAAYSACKLAKEAGAKRCFVIAGSSDITPEQFGCDKIVTLPDSEDKLEEAVAIRNITAAARSLLD
ncbi:MAG: glycerate kinase [Saccharofermentans sp.]|nr:glycerate kinase [Saccharofermentans sp.]